MDNPIYSQLIGNTPLIDISYLSFRDNVKILAKCEFLNPGLSFKDRMAAYIIGKLESHGDLNPGDTLVCASSGNTGGSVAMISAARGYKAIVVTTKHCSKEKRAYIEALGGELIVVDEGSNYIEVAKDISISRGYHNIDQYSNPANPEAYYMTFGPEIWSDTSGAISHFVMTGSTYGCISGVSKYLKEKNKDITTVLVDPEGSNIFNYYYNIEIEDDDTPYLKIEGAGKKEPTACLDFTFIDEVIKVKNVSAFKFCNQFAKETGFLVGGSSGLNLLAAKEKSKSCPDNSIIVTILCDSGVKYYSTIYKSESGGGG